MSTNSATSGPVRLAERDALAVDMCACGTLALHLGGLSLRLDLGTLQKLIDVLRGAVARREVLLASAALREDDSLRQSGARWSGRERRGKA